MLAMFGMQPRYNPFLPHHDLTVSHQAKTNGRKIGETNHHLSVELFTAILQSTIRVSTEVTFWHSAEYGSDFRPNSGEIPRNSAEFRGISPEFSRNHFRSQKIPRNSVLAEFRGHPIYNTVYPLNFLFVA
jgi:hypothetical protein